MTSVEQFEEKAKKVLSMMKESFNQADLEFLAQQDEPENIIVDEQPIEDVVKDEVDVLQPTVVPVEKAPRFRIYWKAWKEGNTSSGQTESNLETANMARAEAMTKLYDLGFNDIEILAIETIKNEPIEEIAI